MTETNETLYTFIVDFQRPASFVSLLGSWDNFQHAYPLKKEVRSGRDIWRRYADFDRVICDGDRLRRPEEGRDGSLKMGGTYWYYYQIDNDGEFCDPSKPTTRTCPFLPGQEVNILEVPKIRPDPRLFGESTALSVYTLDPQEKYRTRPSNGKATGAAWARSTSPPLGASDAISPDMVSAIVGWPGSQVGTPSVSGSRRSQGSMTALHRKRLFSPAVTPTEQVQANKCLLFKRPSTMPSSSRPFVDSDFPHREVRTSMGTREQDDYRPQSSWPRRLTRATSRLSDKLSIRSMSSLFSWRPESRRLKVVMEEHPAAGCLSSPRPSSTRRGSPMHLDFGSERGTDIVASVLETEAVSRSASQLKSQRGSMQRYSNGLPRLVHSNTTSTRSSTFSPLLEPSNGHTFTTGLSVPGTPNSTDAFSLSPLSDRADPPPPSHFPSNKEHARYRYQGHGNNDAGRKTAGMGHGYGHGSGSVLSLHDVDRLLENSASTPARTSPRGGFEDCRSSVTEIEALCRDMGYLGAVITGNEPEWET